MRWHALFRSAPALLPRLLQGALAGVAALICAFWISICAAAPEFIWQGLNLALGHVTRVDMLAALLIGLVLAFFIEPVMERVRDLLSISQHRHPAERRPHDVLFTACLSLVFALTSICLHEAMTAFVANRDAQAAGHDPGLSAGIVLTISWAIVPFAVTIAWLAVQSSLARDRNRDHCRRIFLHHRVAVRLAGGDGDRDNNSMRDHSWPRLPPYGEDARAAGFCALRA